MVPGYWYVVLECTEVRRRPLALTRFGVPMVAWRDAAGRARITADRCPHRGAALSAGRVVEGCIQCPFHGFLFDGEGTCTRIPSNGDKPVPRAYDVRAWAVREAHGYVYLWWGAETAADEPGLPAVPWHPELEGRWRWASFTSEWPVHWSRAVENQLDMSHLPFVHQSTIGAGVPTEVYVNADVDEQRIRATGRLGSEVYVELRLPNIWVNPLGPKMVVQLAFVPVDERRTRQYLRIYQRFVDVPILGELTCRAMNLFNRVILNQDRRVVLTQDPAETALRMDEKLVQADAPIAAFRRWRHLGMQGGEGEEPEEEPGAAR